MIEKQQQNQARDVFCHGGIWFGIAQFGGRDSGRSVCRSGIEVLGYIWFWIRGRRSVLLSCQGLVGLEQRFQYICFYIVHRSRISSRFEEGPGQNRGSRVDRCGFGFQVTGVECHLDLEINVSGQSRGSRVDVVQFKSRSQGQNILIWRYYYYIEVPPGQQRFQGRAIILLCCLSSLRLALRPVRKK